MDPLRAGEVMLLVDGFRFLCDRDCRRRYIEGERAHDRWYRERPSRPPPPRADPTTGTIRTGDPVELEPLRYEPGPLAPPEITRPWLGLIAAVGAVVLGVIGRTTTLAALSALLTCAAAAAALHASWRARPEVGWLAWAVGPAGALLAAFAAVVGRLEDQQTWLGLAGAGIAAGAMVGRSWLDARMRRPVDAVVRQLPHRLPPTVRVPVKDDANPTEVTFVEVETHRVRTGEEALAIEGETVAVDGVVKAGEAWALLHPGARTPVRRGPGDPLLAGARITEGAVRLMATRVGGDRAIVRPARFGAAEGADAAPLARLAAQVTRWGGIAAVGGAAVALAMTDGDGTSAQISAAAAVLLAAPLLAVRRSAELPLIAAAATAGARGIVFHSARALDAAGRVTAAALCTRGIVTEGELEVVEVHAVDDTDPATVIALAAAAEASADNHPIGRAVRRFAESRRIAPESVRRATFLPGRGVTALAPGGEPLVIGNRRLLLDEGVSVAVADAEAARAEARGHTALFVGLGGRVRAVIALQDAVRPGARAAVQRIFDLHVEVVLLSGDHRPTVEALARNLDVANVRAELLPEERGAEVQRLRETGGPVAAVGRPQQDDTALAAADVPIVLGAAGGAAGERAVALATDDVRDASSALWIARAARTASFRAFTTSLVAGSAVVVAGATGIAPPALAAVLALAVDSVALAAAPRLLRRVALRVPARS